MDPKNWYKKEPPGWRPSRSYSIQLAKGNVSLLTLSKHILPPVMRAL